MGEAVLRLRRRSRRWALALAGLASAAALAAEDSPAVPAAGPVVAAIEVRSDAPVDLAEVERLLEIRVGEPLTEDAVRRSLRSLRYAEIASEVSISVTGGEGEGAGAGTAPLTAIVAIWTPVEVVAVEIRGDTGVRRERLQQELPVAPRQVLLEDRVVRGLYALEDFLAAEGYRSAAVHLDVQLDPVERHARVVYEVAAGERTRVGAVRFEGADGIATQPELEKALRSRPGDPFRKRAIEENAEQIVRFLAGRDYRSAEVERLADEPGAEPGTIDLAYRIVPGPKLELHIVGAERKALEKKDLLPFLDGGYDDALVLQAIERIKRFYQEKGNYRVDVRRSEEHEPGLFRLTLEIVPGRRYTLEELTFEGNETFDADRLRRLLNTAPRRLLTPKSGRLVDAELSGDLSNLRSFYALEGFDRAKVGPARIEEEGDRLAVRIPVEEGRRRTLSTLDLVGLAPLDEREIRKSLPLEAGGPYHRLRVEQSEDILRARLAELGYGDAIVDAQTVWSEDELTAAVTLSAIPGRREVVSTLILRGLDASRPDVVRRFLGIEVGDPVSRTALLDVQRRLYSLGVFSRVEVHVPPAGEVGDAREVLIDFAEGKSRAASVGLGYDSESGVRGLLRLSHANLFGRLSSLTLDLLASQREQRSRLIYRQPYVGSFLAELEGAIYDEHDERPDFTVDRRGVQIAVERPIEQWSLQLVGSYRIVKQTGDERTAEIPLESRDAQVASLTPGVSYDRRNDILDPTRGWFASAQVEYAAPVADTTANFVKLFAQASAYRPLGRGVVLAGSLRGGAIEPLATSDDPAVTPLEASVPSPELFYAGGRTSHRAYERDALGIVGETIDIEEPSSPDNPFPTGGGGLLLANVELRIPIFGPVGGTLFIDGGNVWKEYRSVDLSQLKWGAGAGVRYLSPIGPLRLEIGWKLDREPFEDPYVWFFSLGNAF